MKYTGRCQSDFNVQGCSQSRHSTKSAELYARLSPYFLGETALSAAEPATNIHLGSAGSGGQWVKTMVKRVGDRQFSPLESYGRG